jgi:hypothetical protein
MITTKLADGWKRCNGCGSEDSQLIEVAFLINGRGSFKFRLCAVCARELHDQVPPLFDRLMKERSKTEGWAYPEPRAPNTKLHYFVGAETLCKRYERAATVHVVGTVTRPDCCAQCFAKALKNGRVAS